MEKPGSKGLFKGGGGGGGVTTLSCVPPKTGKSLNVLIDETREDSDGSFVGPKSLPLLRISNLRISITATNAHLDISSPPPLTNNPTPVAKYHRLSKLAVNLNEYETTINTLREHQTIHAPYGRKCESAYTQRGTGFPIFRSSFNSDLASSAFTRSLYTALTLRTKAVASSAGGGGGAAIPGGGILE